MPIEAVQFNAIDEPARLFYLRSRFRGIPMHGLHRFVGANATMVVKAAGVIPVVRASGPAMDRGETVTMFNDLCVMAPAALVSAAVNWTLVDDHRVRGQFTNAGQTIAADLMFNDESELVDFHSDDRYAISASGDARQLHWSTPLGSYKQFGAVRLASQGAGRWHESTGAYDYIQLTIDEVVYNS